MSGDCVIVLDYISLGAAVDDMEVANIRVYFALVCDLDGSFREILRMHDIAS